MSILNIEIKAKCSDSKLIRSILNSRNSDFKGTDHQIDTYFKARNGRYKMREGSIEYSLVFYDRENIAGPKRSDVIYYHPRKTDLVKQQLSRALGELVIVDKQREIYYIDNIKFHIDTVKDLGSFVEIEAIDKTGEIGAEKLYEQCREYLALFRIPEDDLLTNSYSDMLLEKQIVIRESSVEEVLRLSLKIPEFADPYKVEEYNKRLVDKKSLLLVADFEGNPAGFKIGYGMDDHFYSWMGGVLPELRKKGIAQKLANTQEAWCRENGFDKIKIKTRNKHRRMLQFLLKNEYYITDITQKENKQQNRILLEKTL